MDSTQSNNNAGLSLLVTIIILVVLGVVYVFVRHQAKLKEGAVKIEGMLGHPTTILLFVVVRILIGVVGVGVLIATVLPGLMPFRAYINQNLEMGGLLFLFLWPAIGVQISLAFIPYKKGWIKARPLAAWVILLVIGYLAVQLDLMAMNLMYSFF